MIESTSGIVMIGAGGHARALQALLEEQNTYLAGYVTPTSDLNGLVASVWLGDDDILGILDPSLVQLVNGIGSISTVSLRQAVFEAAKELGHSFCTVIDAAASVRKSALLGEGVQIFPGAVVGVDVHLAENVIVNSGAIIEHGSKVGAHCHISPGAVLSGDVTVGESTHVGLGARVIQGVKIGSHCTIGAGAVVIRDVPDGSLAMGVPAVTRRPHQELGDHRHVDD